MASVFSIDIMCQTLCGEIQIVHDLSLSGGWGGQNAFNICKKKICCPTSNYDDVGHTSGDFDI